ncbi:MAG: hypothetical protein JWM53_633 [bacterium]|nr:hypothetical protein [bacterium]
MAARQHSTALASFLGRFTDGGGRYDATKFAGELDWRQEDIAAYLNKTPAAVSKNPTSATSQDELARLAALVQHAYELNGDDMRLTVTWLRTPIRALDGASPKQMIAAREIVVVENLLDEMETGLAF